MIELVSLLDSTYWRWISLITTLYVLINDQITILWLPKSADLFVGIGTMVVFLFFILEMAITSVAKKGYFGRGFFVQDLTAVVSLVPDFLLWVFGIQTLNTLQNLVVSRAGRIARMGMRFGRMSKLSHIVSLLGGAEEGRKADDATDPTFIGRILLDVTNRKVILGIIFLLFTLPYFNYLGKSQQENTFELCLRELVVAGSVNVNGTGSTSPQFQQMIGSMKMHNEIKLLVINGTSWIQNDFTRLRSIETLKINIPASQKYVSGSCAVDISTDIKWDATVSLISTGFVVLLLLVGAMMFSSDLNQLVIRPVEQLKESMEKMSSSYEQLNSHEKGNLLGQALDNVGAVIQVAVSLSKKINTSSRDRLAMTLKEVAGSLGANHVCLFCVKNSIVDVDSDSNGDGDSDCVELEHVRSHSLSNSNLNNDKVDINDDFKDLDDPPPYVRSLAEATRFQMKPILINNWKDIMNIQDSLGKSAVVLDDPDYRLKFRKYSIMSTPLMVGSRFVGVLYVHKQTIFHKDVTRFFGDDRASQEQSKSKLKRKKSKPNSGAGPDHFTNQSQRPLRRRNSLRVFRRTSSLHQSRDALNLNSSNDSDFTIFIDKDLHLLQAAGNQVAIMISLIRAVSVDVETKWKQTQKKYGSTLARTHSLEREFKEEGQFALQLLMSGFDRNSLRSVADVPISRSRESNRGSDNSNSNSVQLKEIQIHTDDYSIRGKATTLAGTAFVPRVSVMDMNNAEKDIDITGSRELFVLGNLMASKYDDPSPSPSPPSRILNSRDARLLLSHCIEIDPQTESAEGESFAYREDLFQICGRSSLALRLIGGMLNQRQPGQDRWIDVLNMIKESDSNTIVQSSIDRKEEAVIAASIGDLNDRSRKCLIDIATHPSFTVSTASLVSWWARSECESSSSSNSEVLEELSNGRYLVVPCDRQRYHMEEPIRQHLRLSMPDEDWASKQMAWAKWIDIYTDANGKEYSDSNSDNDSSDSDVESVHEINNI